MKKNSAVVSVALEDLTIDVGLWCDSCALPSRIEGNYMMMVNGVPDHVCTYSLCTDCDREGWLS